MEKKSTANAENKEKTPLLTKEVSTEEIKGLFMGLQADLERKVREIDSIISWLENYE